MNFLSVKDTAAKFELSERRIQQLCDSGRINGAQMISGVWLIPDNAEKPADDRRTQYLQTYDLISLNQLCSMLSISVATGRNWMKLGKLTSQAQIKRTHYFSKEYADSVKRALEKGENAALKSRRNKKYVSGSNIYSSYVSETSTAPKQVQFLLDLIEHNKIHIGELEISALLAECGIQLLLHDQIDSSVGNCLYNYLNGALPLNGYEFLINDLIVDNEGTLAFIQHFPELFQITYRYEEQEDVLGLLYISTKNLGTRKATGSYYTPTRVVKALCNKLFEYSTASQKRFLDPCCGTGNFLLQLPDTINFLDVYGNDTDSVSIKLCRINLAIKYSVKDPVLLYEHVTNEDYLNHNFTGTFDYIIGNPPWGYDYNTEEKETLCKKYEAANGTTVESYDIFIEQALRDLTPHGVVSFVLPEALLNVKSHAPIRKILADTCKFKYLNFLGNAFDKVQCPCIIFQLEYTGEPVSTIGMEVQDGQRSFQINTKRQITPACFSFLTTDEEYSVLNKIRTINNKCYLAGNAKFALGIVTGNNKKYLSNTGTDENEMVLKGSDLCKYRYNSASNYIVFKPESFQQIAPIEYYRAPEKLLYRFICSQLVFAYDDKQTLSLNSCNLVIPTFSDLNMKYILAILNSRVAQYYFKKTFNSVKVLRSHIEQIPIPRISKEQQEDCLKYVEILLTAHETAQIDKIYDELDQRIAHLYDLTDPEYALIKASLDKENLFLP